MMVSREFRCGRLLLALASTALLWGVANSARAVLVAYEGFNYTAETPLVAAGAGLSGGGSFGWATPWDNDTMTMDGPSKIEAGSLTYTDRLGNVLQTSGGKLRNFTTVASTIADQQGRTLAARRAGPTNTTTWISLLGVRQGPIDNTATGLPANTYTGGGNISLFDTTQPAGEIEKLNLGENTNLHFPIVDGNTFINLQQTNPEATALFRSTYGMSGTLATRAVDRWMIQAPRPSPSVTALAAPAVQVNGVPITSNLEFQRDPVGGQFRRFMSKTEFSGKTSFVLMRIDHSAGGPTGRDRLLIWFNQNLNAVPADSAAEINLDLTAFEARATEINFATPFGMTAEGALFNFDRIRMFARQGNGTTQNPVDWLVDELRIGDAFADVTPIAASAGGAVPEPGTLALAAAGMLVALRRRRR